MLGRQRGVGLIAYFAVALAIGAAATGAWAFFKHYQHVLEDRAATKLQLAGALQANDEQAAANKLMREDIRKRDELLAARERARQRAEKERESLHAELQALRAQPEVAVWLDARVPDAVLERLRATPAGAGGGPQDRAPVPADQPAPHDAPAGAGREPQRRPPALGLRLAERLAVLQ